MRPKLHPRPRQLFSLFPQNSTLFLKTFFWPLPLNFMTIIYDFYWQSSPIIIALDNSLWLSLKAIVQDLCWWPTPMTITMAFSYDRYQQTLSMTINHDYHPWWLPTTISYFHSHDHSPWPLLTTITYDLHYNFSRDQCHDHYQQPLSMTITHDLHYASHDYHHDIGHDCRSIHCWYFLHLKFRGYSLWQQDRF